MCEDIRGGAWLRLQPGTTVKTREQRKLWAAFFSFSTQKHTQADDRRACRIIYHRLVTYNKHQKNNRKHNIYRQNSPLLMTWNVEDGKRPNVMLRIWLRLIDEKHPNLIRSIIISAIIAAPCLLPPAYHHSSNPIYTSHATSLFCSSQAPLEPARIGSSYGSYAMR